VLAIALISVSTFFDNWLGTVLTGSLFFLLTAYVIRFYTVARQPVEHLYQRIPNSLFQASVNLGKTPLVTLFKVYLPVLLPAFTGIFLLVLIDVLKELPLTLILRPFNFETLSTSVYGYAKVNESVQEAAPYSLLIITLGVLAAWLLKRLDKKYGHPAGK
jgi:iron(III) transport system permease protein